MSPVGNRRSMHECETSEPMHVHRLEALSSLQDRFQVDHPHAPSSNKDGFKCSQPESFVKALRSNTIKRSKFALLLGDKCGDSQDAFGMDDMLLFSADPIPTSLLSLRDEYSARAVKMFQLILSDMGTDQGELVDYESIKTAQKLLHQGLRRIELRDELYMQLLKQTRGNPILYTKKKAWRLLYIVASAMPPSKGFADLITEYVEKVSREDEEEPVVKEMAAMTWSAMKRTLAAGARKTMPSNEEIQRLVTGKPQLCTVFFLDDSFEEVDFDMTTTIGAALKHLAAVLRLKNYSTFALFECRKTPKPGSGDLIEEHFLLDSKCYVADVLSRMKKAKNEKEGMENKLIVKKRIYRKTDEAISEPQFIDLCYMQAQYDYLSGRIPVPGKDTATLVALQIQADHGNGLLENDAELNRIMIRYIPHNHAMMTQRDEVWSEETKRIYRTLQRFTQDAARLHFLKIHRTLPYGHSSFFTIETVQDPMGLLPNELLLGINRRGLHFLKRSPTEYLYSVELRDIMQFGSSHRAIFFKIRVTGSVHLFQFGTTQGEEMCLALQTHINDVMKSYPQKCQPSGQSVPTAEEHPASETTETNAGPSADKPRSDQEQLIAETKQSVEEKTARIEELETRSAEISAEKEKISRKLTEAQEKLSAEEAAAKEMHEEVKRHEELGETLLRDIGRANEAVVEAEANRIKAVAAARQAADAEMVVIMEQRVEEATKKLAATRDNVTSLEKKHDDARRHMTSVEHRLSELEASRAEETSELKAKIDDATGAAMAQMHETEGIISRLMQDLSRKTEEYNANKLELEEMKMELSELDDLREMKEDVERREKVTKRVIIDQANKLQDLEKIHKEEQTLRKKYMSMLEDMQGKVRVYVRLGPSGESALDVVDEYTVAKADGDKEEFAFDQAYGTSDDDGKVFEGVRQVTARCIDGYNVCVVSYGTAGSGKTHTLFGGDGSDGVIVSAVRDLLATATRRSKKWDFEMTAGMIELSEDRFTDLLESAVKKLIPRKDAKGLVHVINTHFAPVTSVEEFSESLGAGMQKRSASSNAFVTVTIESVNRETGVVNKGRIVFSDLVGCDSGDASIDAMHGVVKALEEGEVDVPYASSPLTKMMSDCLGGNAKTLLLLHVTGDTHRWTETRKALETGLSIRTVKNEIEKGELTKEAFKLKKHIDAMKAEAGIPLELLDAVDMVEIVDRKAPSVDTADSNA